MRQLAVLAVIAAALGAPASAQEPHSKFITTPDGLKIHYFELGTSGSPVVFIDASGK